ncbi:GntR family transcriptional regulator [Albibacillus kandeliae]|uniref:GntR family transcriptional regulator n=1 Tax=Albibacillus kandeliae TaxID=2174228 RepID=UPI000D68565A|nr:GntR family transcriptional regulator [Albibacillus kandeliae]
MAITWQDIHKEALERIHSRDWAPGALIPNEADLAAELGCSRATVNRALRALAEDGWLERRRKAGTRVAMAPQRRARLAIPILREAVEARGQSFAHSLLSRETEAMPPLERALLGLSAEAVTQRVRTLFLADGQPYALEDRWVHLDGAPGFAAQELKEVCANEWLVQHTPFARGTMDYLASPAGPFEARHLGCPEGTALLAMERATFSPDTAVTFVRTHFAPGHRVRLEL